MMGGASAAAGAANGVPAGETSAGIAPRDSVESEVRIYFPNVNHRCKKTRVDDPNYFCPMPSHPESTDGFCWGHLKHFQRALIRKRRAGVEAKRAVLSHAAEVYKDITPKEAAHKLLALAYGRLDVLLSREVELDEDEFSDGDNPTTAQIHLERRQLAEVLKVVFGARALEAFAKIDQASNLIVRQALGDALRAAPELTPDQRSTILRAFAEALRERANLRVR